MLYVGCASHQVAPYTSKLVCHLPSPQIDDSIHPFQHLLTARPRRQWMPILSYLAHQVCYVSYFLWHLLCILHHEFSLLVSHLVSHVLLGLDPCHFPSPSHAEPTRGLPNQSYVHSIHPTHIYPSQLGTLS